MEATERDRRPGWFCTCGARSHSADEHAKHLRGTGAHHTKFVTRALTDEDCADSAEQTARAVDFILQQLSPEQRKERRRKLLEGSVARTRTSRKRAG
jgi:hypothetical protein